VVIDQIDIGGAVFGVARVFAPVGHGEVVVADFPEDALPIMFEGSEVVFAVGSLSLGWLKGLACRGTPNPQVVRITFSVSPGLSVAQNFDTDGFQRKCIAVAFFEFSTTSTLYETDRIAWPRAFT
jgi:hypothetical protein